MAAPTPQRWLSCCAEGPDAAACAAAGAAMLCAVLADAAQAGACEARVCAYGRWAAELAAARDAHSK